MSRKSNPTPELKSPSQRARSPRRIRRLRELLLTWYRAHRRDLPWRRTRDPYAILVSEIMLQQTRVDTVIPYYERFMQRFPNAGALACADGEEVLSNWAGLGYYSRARNLQAAAQQVVDDYGGDFPETADELRELPGIGPYTAGAVASIAFDRPEPIVDGNVTRLLCRLFDIGERIDQRPTQSRLWELAAAFAAGPSPGDLNQALMEMGSLICTPREPQCPKCPLHKSCGAFRAGNAEELPNKPSKRPSPVVRAVGVLARRGDKALFVKRAPNQLLGGLWELPGKLLATGEKPLSAAQTALRCALSLDLDNAEIRGEVRHIFSHRDLRLVIVEGEARGRIAKGGIFVAHSWLSPTRLAARSPTALTRKALEVGLRDAAED